MRGRRRLCFAAGLAAAVATGLGLAPGIALAQGGAATPARPVYLVAPGDGEVPSRTLARHLAAELSRRRQDVVTAQHGAARLGRPLTDALRDCSGDDLCYAALGQVVGATHVVVAKAAIYTRDASRYDCRFRVVEVRTTEVKLPMRVSTIATDSGLLNAARSALEQIAPRPAMTAVSTPPPVVPSPTPTVVATPAPTPEPEPTVAVATAEPTPAPDPEPEETALVLDAVPEDPPPAGVRRPRKSLTRDPTFWSIAGATVVVLGVGVFFGASALREEDPENRGTSTVEVRF